MNVPVLRLQIPTAPCALTVAGAGAQRATATQTACGLQSVQRHIRHMWIMVDLDKTLGIDIPSYCAYCTTLPVRESIMESTLAGR